MTNHPNRRLPILGSARRAFPGDQVYIMGSEHVATDGTSYPRGTEYTPLSCGGTPAVQTVTIRGRRVEFTAA